MSRHKIFGFLLTGLLAGCGGNETSPSPGEDATPESAEVRIQQGFESPEAAFAALQEAATEKDYPQMVAALTAESQQALAGQMMFALQMVAAFDSDLEPKIRELLERHGITEENQSEPPANADFGTGPAAMVRAIGSMVNAPAPFVADALALMESGAEGSKMDEWGAGTLSDLSVNGDQATATIQDASRESPIEFRKISTGWLVHIPDEEFDMSMAAGGNADQTDFDEFKYHYEEEDELPPPTATTKEDFQSAWQTSVELQNVVAADALKQIANEAGLQIFEQPELAETLQQKISLSIKDGSRLQAIEQIAEQLGLYPRYKLKTVAFAEGPRPFPVIFVGPFAVFVEEVNQYPPHPVGRLSLSLFAAGMPTPMVAQMASLDAASDSESAGSMTVKISELKHADQQLTREKTVSGTMREASRATIRFNRRFELIHLLQQIDSIDPIQGSISWPFPTQIQTLKFDAIKADTVAGNDDFTLKLTRASSGSNPQLRVSVEGIESRFVRLIARDEQGQPLPHNFHSASDFGDQSYVEVMVDGTPASLEAQVVTAADRISYSFELPSIPLPDHEQMPAELAELKIEGDSPLSFETTNVRRDGQFRKVTARAENRTNKAVHRILVKLDYTDDSGRIVKDFQHSQQGNRVLLEAGASDEIEVTAFFMPEEATGVTLSPMIIVFADGTEWKQSE